MKLFRSGAFILAAGLLLASCGNATEENTTTEDTMQMETPPAMEETPAPMPDTVNGIDTTVNVNGQTNKGVGPADAKIGG
jgi:hypothetical protein